MNPITKIRYGIGCLTLVGLIVYGIVSGIAGLKYVDDHASKEKIRRSADIVRMWKEGFSSSRVPNMKPAEARRLLSEVIASRSEEKTKDEARVFLAELDAKPRYFAFVERAGEFLPHVDEYLALGEQGSEGGSAGKLPAGKFVVFERRAPDTPAEGEKPEAYFDAEMIEACGDRLAMSPGEVAAVIVTRSDRQQIGTYQQRLTAVGGKKIDPDDPLNKRRGIGQPFAAGPAYREICGVMVRAYPSGALVALKLISADDPKKITRGLGVEEAPSAREQVRSKLTDYLKGLAEGKL